MIACSWVEFFMAGKAAIKWEIFSMMHGCASAHVHFFWLLSYWIPHYFTVPYQYRDMYLILWYATISYQRSIWKSS
jgi:hypothetical protein